MDNGNASANSVVNSAALGRKKDTATQMPGHAVRSRPTPAVRARSSGRSMKCVLPPLTGLLACGLLAGLINSAESAQTASFAASAGDAARERSTTARLGDDFSLPNAYTSAQASSPLTTQQQLQQQQQAYSFQQPSVVDLFENCAVLFRFAVEDLSPEERQTALANWCSKVLFGNFEEDDDSSMLIGDSGLSEDKRAAKTQKFMHFGRKKRDLNAITAGVLPSALDKDKRAGQNRMLHFGKRENSFGDYQNTPEMNDALRQLDDLVKRAGQNRMLHFGKRSPNRFMHFGKRNPNSRFLHFGKRTFDQDETEPYAEKRANRFMHFGKREDEETDAVVNMNALEDELIKRSTNSRFMHFGKKRAGSQKYMHFGKRPSNGLGLDDDPATMSYIDNLLKRSPQQNRYLHFGKKAANRFMHFGKRADSGDQEPSSGTASMDFEADNLLMGQQDQVKERKRRSILSDADVAEIGAEFGLSPEEVRPASQKRFTITYPSPIFQQALARHRLDLLAREDVGDQDGGLNGVSGPLGHGGSGSLNQQQQQQQQQNTAAFVGSEDLLDRMGRSEQFQIPQPKAQSRWTRPDRNVFLHFG